MKRRILMVSAMILLLGSQMQMSAQRRCGSDDKRPGMEMLVSKRPGGPKIEKAICQSDIMRVQEIYWTKYRVKLSKKEAEKIVLAESRDRHRYDFAHRWPSHRKPAFGAQHKRPGGPQKDHKK